MKKKFFRKFFCILLLTIFIPLVFALADSEGQVKSFFVDSSFDLNHQEKVSAVLRKVSEKTYFYLENEWYQELTAEERKKIDEFIAPLIVGDYQGMKDADSVVFFNFRSDRPRQLTRAFVDKRFNKFKRRKLKLIFICMKEYYKGVNALRAFEKEELKNILGEVISKNNIKQLRIAETEKYAHITFFLDALREKPFPKEERALIPSPKIATYDLKPEMSAFKVTKSVLKAIDSEKYGFIVLNFANPDMLGHTGKLKAAIKAIEIVDKCLGEIINLVIKKRGIALITADHGNAEEMIGQNTGRPLSKHTTNLVPFIIVSDRNYILRKGKLGDIAPTILKLLDIKKPKEMTGTCLF